MASPAAGALPGLGPVFACRVVLGVTLTAYLTHASGLVAAREAGVLKRWRATRSPAGATWPAACAPPSCWPWPRARSPCWWACSPTTSAWASGRP